MEKDLEKAKRLNEVYKYLFANYGVSSQKDLADKLKVQRSGLSAAMNGTKANLTKNLFTKICASFPGIFNIDYLLTGRGTLLADQPSPSEPSTDNDVLASKNETIEAMRRELQAKEDLIAILREQINFYKSMMNNAQPYPAIKHNIKEQQFAADGFQEVK